MGQMYILTRPRNYRPEPLRRSQSREESESGEKELGLFLQPSGLLWVLPTSWLQPEEASQPGNLLWAQQAAGGEEERAKEEQLWGRATSCCSVFGERQLLCNAKTLGKEAEEWPAWGGKSFPGRESLSAHLTLLSFWRNVPTKVPCLLLPSRKPCPGFCVHPCLFLSSQFLVSPPATSTNQSWPLCSWESSLPRRASVACLSLGEAIYLSVCIVFPINFWKSCLVSRYSS